MLKRIVSTMKSPFEGKRMESDLDEELRFHVERETEENVRRGMRPEDARTQALRRFGGVEKTKEECRDAGRAVWLESFLQDVRYAARSLRKNPGYAAAAVLTLALGIGANTAIFSVVYGVLLQSLPYGGGDRLVRLRVDAPGAGITDGRFSPPDVADLRGSGDAFDAVAEYHSMWFVLLGRPEPERVQTGVVSANFFDLLGVRPILGRTFRTGEDQHGAEAVLVLSNSYWLRSFGGDPSVVGRVFRMNDRPHTVIGVLPPIPGYPEDNDVYMPVSACPFRSDPEVEHNRDAGMLRAFARLKPGATLRGAQAQLNTLVARLEHDYPGSYPASIHAAVTPVPLRDELTAQARPTFLLLSGMVGLVLLLACASVANLSLARLVRREKELALRSALGASRRRLARQLLTESLLVALTGGVLGLLLAVGCRQLLVMFAARLTPRASEIAIEGPVLLFTLGVSLLVGLALGLVPALSSRRSLVTALQEGRDTSAPGGPARRQAARAARRGAGRDLLRPPRRSGAHAAHALEARADRPRLQDREGPHVARRPELLSLPRGRAEARLPDEAPRQAFVGAGRRLRRTGGELPAVRPRPRERPLPHRGTPRRGAREPSRRGLPARELRLLQDDRGADSPRARPVRAPTARTRRRSR